MCTESDTSPYSQVRTKTTVGPNLCARPTAVLVQHSRAKHAACPICTYALEEIKLTSSETPSCSAQPMKTISMPDLSELYDSGIPITLIDVRELTEWASGHLDGAQHIPLGKLLSQEQQLDDIDPKNLIVVYCQHGIRSAQAVAYLRSKGYEALKLLVDWT